MGGKPETEEALHGGSENAHFHDPGSGNAVGHRSLAPVAWVRRGGIAFPLGLADWFAPFLRRSHPLLLVCRSVHLHRLWNASSYRRAGLPGEIGTLSLGT